MHKFPIPVLIGACIFGITISLSNQALAGGPSIFLHIRIKTVKQVIKASKGLDVPDTFLLFPIPQAEIDNNADIGPTDQNPGY